MPTMRENVVKLAESWVGFSEKNGKYKQIIDVYNSYGKSHALPRGTKMLYEWPWCACTWSALAIQLGYTDIMPIEISVPKLIELAKKQGIWIENDGYVPSIGDAICYDWQDTGKGDNVGGADHIGVVTYVNEKSGYFVVVEGNYNDAVKKRTVSINGRYIRGFIVPKYDQNGSHMGNTEIGKSASEVAHEVIVGKWSTGEDRKRLLTAAGYDYAEIQKMVNNILNTPTVTPEPPKCGEDGCEVFSKVKSTVYSKNYSDTIKGTYATTTALYLRNDAGTNKKALVLMPKGLSVRCYGYYTPFNNANWFYVVATHDGVEYTGFCHSKYLVKK